MGHCYLNVTDVSLPTSDLPMGCTRLHRAETFSVGTFAAEYAAGVGVPPSGSPGRRWAFQACDAEGKRFVGGDWRGGRLFIQVVVPSADSWAAGSRWYRCDIFELASMDGGTRDAVERTGSLRDALTRLLPLVYTCFNRDRSHNLQPVSCGKRHRLEFAGILTAPEVPYHDLNSYEAQFFKSCWSVIAEYVGVSKKVDMGDYVGVNYRTPSHTQWGGGDRGIRCFLWSDDHDLTRSAKGAGLRALE